MAIDWFEVSYTVIGGLGVFLYGMKGLGESLEALASDYIRKAIGWLTNNRLLAVLVGFVVTGIVQSSSVTTVMAIGFVNAGLMTLTQSIGVVLGANVGTTVTGWILALKVGKYGLAFLALGLVPFFFMKNVVWRSSGKILIALGLIFLGLNFMSGGFTPLTKDPAFAESLSFFAADNMLSVLACATVGCLLTFVVQSSSAMLGVTIALATTAAEGQAPVIGLDTAVALVLGQNVGTTITAQLASIGGNAAAKRTAMAHTLFNVLGALLVIPLFRPYLYFIEELVAPAFHSFAFLFQVEAQQSEYAIVGFEIAAAHTVFNVVAVVIFLPFVDQLARLVTWMVPDSATRTRKGLRILGNPYQISPELALEEAEGQIRKMAAMTQELLAETRRYLELNEDNPHLRQEIDAHEELGDDIQKEITVFVTTVLQRQVTPSQSRRGYVLIRLADEIESIGDYCKALAKYQIRLFREHEHFSRSAAKELRGLMDLAVEFFAASVEAVGAGRVSQLGPLIDRAHALRDRANEIRLAHLDRVRTGDCEPLAGMTFSDMVVAIRRIKNHTVNMLETMVPSSPGLAETLGETDVASGDDAARLHESLRSPAPSAHGHGP